MAMSLQRTGTCTTCGPSLKNGSRDLQAVAARTGLDFGSQSAKDIRVSS